MVGGWSIDLFIGHQSREHSDLEIAVLRDDFSAVRRALAGLRFHTVNNGQTPLLPDDTEPPGGIAQVRVLDPRAQLWRTEVMLEPGDAMTWRFRYNRAINSPRADMMRSTPDGIPYLCPQGTLLYKARRPQPTDQQDFDLAIPHMDPSARAWLGKAIVTYLGRPQHPWITALT